MNIQRNSNAEPRASTIFFPLRTNIEYFSSPKRFLSLERRLKEAAILYDTIVFEGGIYEEIVLKGGGRFDLGKRGKEVTVEDLNKFVLPTGTSGTIQLTTPEGERLKPSPFDADRHYRSEFHTCYSYLRDTLGFCPEWIRLENYDLSKEMSDEMWLNLEKLADRDIVDPRYKFLRGRRGLR